MRCFFILSISSGLEDGMILDEVEKVELFMFQGWPTSPHSPFFSIDITIYRASRNNLISPAVTTSLKHM